MSYQNGEEYPEMYGQDGQQYDPNVQQYQQEFDEFGNPIGYYDEQGQFYYYQ